MGAGGLLLGRIPLLGTPVHPGRPLETVDTALKKRMADIALNAGCQAFWGGSQLVNERVDTGDVRAGDSA